MQPCLESQTALFARNESKQCLRAVLHLRAFLPQFLQTGFESGIQICQIESRLAKEQLLAQFAGVRDDGRQSQTHGVIHGLALYALRIARYGALFRIDDAGDAHHQAIQQICGLCPRPKIKKAVLHRGVHALLHGPGAPGDGLAHVLLGGLAHQPHGKAPRGLDHGLFNLFGGFRVGIHGGQALHDA